MKFDPFIVILLFLNSPAICASTVEEQVEEEPKTRRKKSVPRTFWKRADRTRQHHGSDPFRDFFDRDDHKGDGFVVS